MMRALYTAASGMIAQQTNVDVISNNLANVNSTGYKASTAEFKSLLYQTLQSRSTSANGDDKPIPAQVGTVARDKQTLENLKNTIYKVCEGEIKPHTKTVRYEQEIEENLEKIVGALDTDSLKNEYSEKRNMATDIEVEENKISKKLYRWIAIKLIDGEEKILKSIQENLELNLGEQEIQQSVIEAKKNLETREITSKNFKDKIVADIMKKAEETSKEVCHPPSRP